MDFCDSAPCLNGGTCHTLTSGAPRYTCTCPFGVQGYNCEVVSHGFAPLSFMTFSPLWGQQKNTIVVEFSTNQDGLLLFSARDEEFVALQIVGGRVMFSFSLGEVPRELTVQRTVTDSRWYRIEATRQLRESHLKVHDCPDSADADTSNECNVCSDSSCYSYDNAAQHQ